MQSTVNYKFWSVFSYAVAIVSSETIVFVMQLHLPCFLWDCCQYAFTAFNMLGIICSMELEFWSFSEIVSHKLFGGWGVGSTLRFAVIDKS